MKKKKKDIAALPSKRVYLPITVDYDLPTSLCELIDNALDNWIKQGKVSKLQIIILLDYDRQYIEVTDNSGGIAESDLEYVVSPGLSHNTGEESTIGFFGVGSKRAVVSLAEEIKIYSRFKNKETHLVEINDAWIRDDNDWNLPAFEVDPIDESSTKIELLKLRDKIEKANEPSLVNHLGAIYCLFLANRNLEIKLNATVIKAVSFEHWSFPPGFEPKSFSGQIDFNDRGKVSVAMTGGLTKSGEPSSGEYGLYLYCNNRLVARAYKGPEIGFRQSRIGEPHPAASLARIIVKITGPSQLMPWNSSKSDINAKHQCFRELQSHIDKILYHYANLSKRWSTGGGWEENVFKFTEGEIQTENLSNISSTATIHLPPIPRISSRKYADIIKGNNRKLAEEKPWVKGFYEATIAVEELPRLKLEQNNRLSLLILDSMLEIAFKEYLVNDSGTYYSDVQLKTIFDSRHKVQQEVKKTVNIPAKYWKKVDHFYRIRSELVHKKASVNISDDDLTIFRRTYEYIIRKIFKVNFNVKQV